MDARRGVVPRDANAADWRQRYEALLQANERLTQQLRRQDAAHRRALTVVKYAPSLPNNDVFTKQLVDENRELLHRFRALELRLAKLDATRANSAPSSPRRSIDRARKKAKAVGLPVKHASVQTADSGGACVGELIKADMASERGAEKEEKKHTENRIPEEVRSLIETLKQRLGELDVDLSRLREENDLLRQERSSHENDSATSNLLQYEELREQLRTREEQQELEHLLRDRMRQLQILEQQFSHLQSKIKSKTLLYNESLSKIEELTRELFDAKQRLLQQAEWLHAQEDTKLQLSLLEKEVHALRSENATLNEAVSVLSARPLDALSQKLESKALEISLLDDQNAKLEDELQKARQDHRIVMQTNAKLRAHVEALAKQLESPLAEIEALKAEKEQSVMEREVAELQLQFHLSDKPIESRELMEAVGRALKQMRSHQSPHEPAPAESAAICVKCHGRGRPGGSGTTLQQERIEKMAETTKLIQEDLRAELRDMRVAHQAEVAQLRRKCVRWERRANEYVAKIAALQRETERTQPHQRIVPQSSLAVNTAIHEAKGSRPADQVDPNLLEVRVFDLRLAPSTHCEAASLVLFCDYFDFESQHSPVFALDPDATAVAPIELEVSYRLVLDRAFCRSPIAQSLTIELHRLGVASSTVVGIADVSLVSMFLSEQGRAALSLKLQDPTTRATVGSLRVTMLLAHPVSDLFKAWHVAPDPKLWSLARPDRRPHGDPIVLSVRIIAFALAQSSMPDKTGQASVRYRFMGHPPVRHSSQRVQLGHGYGLYGVDRLRSFEIPHDEHILDFLDRYELVVSVGEPPERGEASVSFKAIVSGFRATGNTCRVVSSTLQNRDGEVKGHGRVIGRVWVEIQAFDSTSAAVLTARNCRGPIGRVFGSGTEGYVNWRRFCQVMQFTAAERAIRQVIWEKTQLRPGSLDSLIGKLSNPVHLDDVSLTTLLEQSGVRFSRSELCFIGGSMLVGPDENEDDLAANRFRTQQTLQRLLLVLSTVDAEWVRLESVLRMHVETLELVTEHHETDPEPIDWGSFVQHLRLGR